MVRKSFIAILHVAIQTPSWVMLLVGIATVAATLLVGPYLDNQRLAQQRDQIEHQVTRLVDHRDSYRRMLDALDSDDPILLQRLAYHYLRLKPVGVTVMNQQRALSGVIRPVAEPVTTIDTWIQRDMPAPPPMAEAPSWLDSRVIRFTTGPLRPLVAAFGAVAIAIGLVPIGLKRSPQP
ncbi:MAG: hypothetical protein WD042_18545 [Phycisphaeraceae bacterium]